MVDRGIARAGDPDPLHGSVAGGLDAELIDDRPRQAAPVVLDRPAGEARGHELERALDPRALPVPPALDDLAVADQPHQVEDARARGPLPDARAAVELPRRVGL